jgi:hypothetical protein
MMRIDEKSRPKVSPLNVRPERHAPPISSPPAAFDLVRRGYDRQQVDHYVQTVVAQVAELRKAHQLLSTQLAEHEQGQQPLRAQIMELQTAYQREHTRAEQAHTELRALQSQLEQVGEQPGGQGGFGYRVEKLLRAAEDEAADVRSSAAREAASELERARKDAETHRHQVEQSLIQRAAEFDREIAERKVDLDDREIAIAQRADAARQDAERTVREAHRQATQLHDETNVWAEQERLKVEKSIRERREEAEQELARLHLLHDDVRNQLAALQESLAAEFGSRTPSQPRAHQVAQAGTSVQNGPVRGTDPGSRRPPRPHPPRQPMPPRVGPDSLLP